MATPGTSAISDRDEICELHSRYNHYMDSYERDAFVELFTADGSWELVGLARHEGHSGLAAFIDGLRESAGQSHLFTTACSTRRSMSTAIERLRGAT